MTIPKAGPMTDAPETREYEFKLIVAGIPELTDAVADALYAAGYDDGTPVWRDGAFGVGFAREAATFSAAVASTVRDVEAAGLGARVVRIESGDLVNASEIGRRIGRSREAVRKYALGERGPGGFPPPVSDGIWRWSEVAAWAAASGVADGGIDLGHASETAAVNDVFDLRRHVDSQSALVRLWRSLQPVT